MRSKYIVQLASPALGSLPILALLISWNRLPTRLPLHFDELGQPDQFGTRHEWLTRFFWVLLLMTIIRTVFVNLVTRQTDLRAKQRVILQLLMAGFTAGASLLLIGQGVWSIPLYREWMPVLFFSFGSGCVYYGVPPDLPATQKLPPVRDRFVAQQAAYRQHMHALTRMVTIRVNLMAVLIMLVVDGQDRWSVGFLANLLAYVCLAVYSIYQRRTSE